MFSLSGISPAPGEKLVELNSVIEFSILDDTTGIDISTLIVEIGGFRAIENMAFSLEFSGTESDIVPSGDNYFIIIDPTNDLSVGGVYDIKVQVKNLNGEYFNYSYSFKTLPTEPILISTNPKNRAILLCPEVLYLEVEDSIDGINSSSINVYLNELQYINNGTIITDYNGPKSSIVIDGNTAKIKIDPIEPLRNDNYILEYSVSDTNGNKLSSELKFSVKLKELVPPPVFTDTGFLGYYQGIKRVSDIGEGNALLLEFNEPIKKIYNNDLFILAYENSLRLSVFDSPKYICDSTVKSATINSLETGKTISFGARSLEVEEGVFNLSGMTSVDTNFYLIPDPITLTAVCNITDYTVSVSSTTGYPDAGLLLIGVEVIRYDSVNRTNNTFSIPTNGRELLNSTASIYLEGDEVRLFLSQTDDNTVIIMSTPTYQDGYDFDRFIKGEGVLVTDSSDNDRIFFQGYDFCGWHDPRPDQTLTGKDDCGSYLGGEFNGFRGFDLYERMLNREEVLLQTTGEPVILLKRIWDGMSCSCSSSRKMSPKMKSCKICYGTGYKGGFTQFEYLRREDKRIMASFDEASEDLFHGESENYQQAYEPSAWTLAIPAIRDRDLLVRFDLTNDLEFIYEVLNVSREKILNRASGRQKLSLKRLDKTDIVYTYKLDLTNII